MNLYYDPWTHCARMLVGRVTLFFGLSLLLGLSVWAGLLHWVFEADGMAVFNATWALLEETELLWRVVFWQSAASGMLVTTVLFVWLMGRARLRREEQVRVASVRPINTR